MMSMSFDPLSPTRRFEKNLREFFSNPSGYPGASAALVSRITVAQDFFKAAHFDPESEREDYQLVLRKLKLEKNDFPQPIQKAFNLQGNHASMKLRPVEALRQLKDLAAFVMRGRRLVEATPISLFPAHDIQDSEQAIMLHHDFKQRSAGEAVQQFCDQLDQYGVAYKQKPYYGKSIAILQSSGTGKSKLMRDLSSRIPSLTICMRRPQGYTPEHGWPPSDKSVYEYLVGNHTRVVSAELRFAALLAAIYRAVDFILEDVSPTGCPTDSLGKLCWHFELDTPEYPPSSRRHQSFTEIVLDAEQILTSALNSADFRQGLAMAHAEAPVSIDVDAMDTDSTSNVNPATARASAIYKRICYDAVSRVARKMKELGHKHFVLGFDECHYLDPDDQDWAPLNSFPSDATRTDAEPIKPSLKMSLSAVQRVIKAADAHPLSEDIDFWYTFLSTDSTAFLRAPRKGPALASARHDTIEPLPAYHNLSFDLLCPRELSVSPNDALYLHRLVRYGRPLWHTVQRDVILPAAVFKLFCGTFSPTNEHHVLAAMSHRVLFEFSHGAGATRVAVEAVRAHMRYLTLVADRRCVHTAVPSEPVLSLAAMDAMNTSEWTRPGDRTAYATTLRTLCKTIISNTDIIEPGDLGALMAQIYLTLARDEVHKADFMDGPFVRPVALDQFLIALLGEQNLDANLLDSAKGKFVNFTHFHQLSSELDDVTPEFLRRAWDRGAALQCRLDQAVLNVLMVTYSGRVDQPWDDTLLGTVAFRMRYQAKAAASSLVDALAGPLISGHRPESELVIFMDFGTTASFEDGTHIQCTHEAVAKQPNDAWAGYLPAGEPKRWCINVRDCDSVAYPVVEGFYDEAGFAQIFNHAFHWHNPVMASSVKYLEDSLKVGLDKL